MKCVRCSYSACATCLGTWMETRTVCPNPDCSMPFTREILVFQLPKLVPILDKKRKEELWEVEKERIPETMEFLEPMRKFRELEKDREELTQRKKALQEELAQVSQKLRIITSVNGLIKRRNYADIGLHMAELSEPETERPSVSKRRRLPNADIPSVKTVVCPCPDPDCRGMIMHDTAEGHNEGACAVCSKRVCTICRIVVADAHECNPDDIASAKLVMQDSKPCPKCGTRISKVEGCDQMWCVACHTPFSWTRGTIETGSIHNPHYFDFMHRVAEQRARDGLAPELEEAAPARAQCQQRVALPRNAISIFVTAFHKFSAEKKFLNVDITKEEFDNYVLASLRFIGENEYNAIQPPAVVNNVDLRFQYVMKEIDEDALKSKLVQRDKRYDYELSSWALENVFLDTMNVLLQNLIEACKDSCSFATGFAKLKIEVDNLVKICNEQFAHIAKVNGLKARCIFFDKEDANPFFAFR